MALVTLQIIEGLERGQVFSDLPTPISVGREDDNVIRLNDERVSRFHAKIQEDGGRVILTDLDSTNGTRVNGHPVQMRVLQVGDQLSVGRCLLIYGSREEISDRAAQFQEGGKLLSDAGDHTVSSHDNLLDDDNLQGDNLQGDNLQGDNLQGDNLLGEGNALEKVGDFRETGEGACDELLGELFPDGPPDPPRELRPVQRAEISDYLSYVHDQIRSVLTSGFEEPNNSEDGMQVMRIGWLTWQQLLTLEMDLAIYLRKIADPDE